MTRLDERTRARMDVALEDACREFPHGGDHELRKRVAQKLLLSARKATPRSMVFPSLRGGR